jgi:NAD(P)-dependent dehydrogenase (short-subunit alcohol dehydrogenase family)/catechol 2,3-dioxygenase-like lactoylglutathione lyase family enzyme
VTTTTPRAALVTGASRGLGLALARALAHQGWHLVIDARGADALESARAALAAHTNVVAIPGDVTDPAHREALAAAARDLGGLDVMVNNASYLGPSPQPVLLEYPIDVLTRVYQTNTVAPLALLQAARDTLKPGARILNITSDAGVEAYEGWGGYGSSKAALEQLSHILAAERPDWRVYWVDPGDMRTRMHQEAFPGEDISDRPPPEESVPGLLTLLTGDLPSGRYQARALGAGTATSDDIADDHATGTVSDVRELRVALTVDDYERVVTFYRDGLNLPVALEWSDAEGRGVVLAAGRATLEIIDHDQADRIDRVEAGRRVAGPVRLAIGVGDLAAAANRLLRQGAQALHDPVQTPWGDHNQRLAAPDGMNITVFEEGPSVTTVTK